LDVFLGFFCAGFRDFVAVFSEADVVAEELADDDPAEVDALLVESEPSGSAQATPVAAAAPTPNATARAPTRPTSESARIATPIQQPRHRQCGYRRTPFRRSAESQ
jgi:hypothetical protein